MTAANHHGSKREPAREIEAMVSSRDVGFVFRQKAELEIDTFNFTPLWPRCASAARRHLR